MKITTADCVDAIKEVHGQNGVWKRTSKKKVGVDIHRTFEDECGNSILVIETKDGFLRVGYGEFTHEGSGIVVDENEFAGNGGGNVDRDGNESFEEELEEYDTKPSLRFTLPAGTRIAVVDGMYFDETEKPENSDATIIVCNNATKVYCRDNIKTLGCGDHTVYLKDISGDMVGICSEPTELEDAVFEPFKRHWRVSHLVVTQ